MKRAFLAAFLLCIAATPTPAPTGAPEYVRFIGSWNCSTAAGSSVEMDFSTGSGSLKLHTSWKNGKFGGLFDHVFTAAANGTWTTTQYDGTNALLFSGTSAGFDGDTISFAGMERDGSRISPHRETFRFTSYDAFQHIWYSRNASGQWEPVSFAECTKVST